MNIIDFSFADLPLYPSNKLSYDDLITHNIFLIGDSFDNPEINSILEEVQSYHIIQNNKKMYLNAYDSPYNVKNMVVIYKSSVKHKYYHIIDLLGCMA